MCISQAAANELFDKEYFIAMFGQMSYQIQINLRRNFPDSLFNKQNLIEKNSGKFSTYIHTHKH